jgi:hypothetical protein
MAKLKDFTKSDLDDIEITIVKKKGKVVGFTVWVIEDVKNKNTRHWLIDASCLKEDGNLILGYRGNNYNKICSTSKSRFRGDVISFKKIK